MEDLTTYHWWQIISGIISFVAAIAAGTVAFVQSKHEKSMNAIQQNSDELKQIQNKHSNEITALQTTVNNMPEYKNMEKVNDDIRKVDNHVHQLSGKIDEMNATLKKLDNYLLTKQ